MAKLEAISLRMKMDSVRSLGVERSLTSSDAFLGLALVGEIMTAITAAKADDGELDYEEAVEIIDGFLHRVVEFFLSGGANDAKIRRIVKWFGDTLVGAVEAFGDEE